MSSCSAASRISGVGKVKGWIFAGLALFSALLAAEANAAVTVNKAFAPSSTTVTGTSTLTITLGNTGGAAATATAVTDTLPSGLVVASPGNVATTCGGTATAVAGSGTVSLSGGTIPASGGSCTVTVSVTSAAIGNYTNTIPAGGVTSSQGSNGAAASATLAVLAKQPVTGTYSLARPGGSAGNLKGNGPAYTMTLRLNNTNTIALTNLGGTLSLQQPMLGFATPPNATSTCGSATVNAAAGTLAFSGGTIAAGGNCQIVFDIIAAQPNTYYNGNTSLSIAANNLTSAEGVTNTAAINAATGVQAGSRVDKSFLPNSIVSGAVSTVTLTINNFNASTLTPINLTDALPAATVVAPVPNASTTCGGTVTATAGAGTASLANGTLPGAPLNANAAAQCTVTFDVVGTNNGGTNATARNSIPAGNFAGVGYPATSADLVILPNQPLAGSSKVISNQNYAGTLLGYAGSTHALTITLNNTTLSPITVTTATDDLSTMGAGFVVAPTPNASTTCAGGTVSAPAGGTLVTLSGGTIPASNGVTPGTCTITATIYIPMTAAALGIHTNTIPAGNIVTSAGSNATPVTFAIRVYTPLAIVKAITPAAVNPGGTTTLRLTLLRSVATGDTGVDPLTNITGADNLPAGTVIATPSGMTTTCTGASITAPAGGSTVSFSGVNLAPGTNCTIDVGVTVAPATAPGTLQNVIPASSLTTGEGLTNNTRPVGGGSFGDGSTTANLTVANASITINKTFTPANVAAGAVSQLAVNFVNNNPGAIAVSQAALTDNLPVGMVVAATPGATFTGAGCTGATITAAAGASTVGITGATMNAGSTCTLTVNVVANAAGNLINMIPAGALTTRENVVNLAPTTATLAVSGTADLSITKTDGQVQVATGTTTTYTVTVSNAGPNNVIGAVVADTPPSGMTITGWNCAASSGASCGAASGSGAISDTIAINVGSTVTYTVNAQVAPNFAGATIVNTATVTQPALVTDPTAGNNSASDSNTVVQGVTLALTKTDGATSYTPGGTATYTITVANTGAANATQVNVTDTLPTGVTLSAAATCTAAGTATCGTVSGGAGQGSFGATGATIPAGAGNTLTFTVPVSFGAGMTTNPLVNTVNATDIPSGATGTANDSDTRSASADVSIAKSGPASVVAGGPISYTLVIGNTGPSSANGTTFSDAVPAAVTGITATCGSPTGGAACPASVTVAGNTVSGTIPTLPAGGSVTITINGTTTAGNGATLSNVATATAPGGTTDPANGNNSSTATTTIKPVLSVTKTADTTTLVPGGSVNYTITVSNVGPVDAPGTLVTDPVATGIASQAWTCVGAGGATCTPSGSGAINDTLTNFPAGGSVTYTVSAVISLTPPANVTNTASAALTNAVCAPANTASPCTATASLPPVPQVGISKSADTTTVVPGGTIHYTIVVSNTGVMAANNTPVTDPVPTGIASQTWTCAGSSGALCPNATGNGAINETIATFPAGGFVTYSVTATVAATPPGVISNTATANPGAAGSLCTPANTAPPCTATANVTSNPQVSITKTADTSTVVPGGTIVYTITVTNTGPSAADGTTVDDAVPTGIASQAWTCAANAGATCTASGTGAISDTLATFPSGSFVTYTVIATVAPNAPASIDNVATADPPPGGICTPGNTPAPCTATASVASVPQLSVTKTADVTTLTPGGTITYTVVVSNTGPVDANGTPVTDPVPVGIASQTWTCSASGGASCAAGGSGAIGDTLATFPSGSFVTYTIVATVDANPPAFVSNTVSATPPGDGVCAPANTPGPCTATATVSPQAQVAIAKTADVDTVTPAGTIHFTVTVSNTGSVAADGTTVSDPVAAGIASQTWTCAPSGGATCAPSGTGAINDTLATFPAGSYAVYTITAAVSASPPASLSNTATATPADGVCTPTNTPPPCSATASVPPVPQVAVTKTADTDTATPNGTITYTVVVSNSGQVAADGTTVSDPVATGIASQAWTCVPNAGATCTASGTGAVNDTLATFPAGSFVTYTIVGTVGATPPATLTNTASATPPGGGVCAPGNTAPPCTSAVTAQPVPLVSITKTSTATILSPGGSVNYTVTVTNAGSAAANGTTVSDPVAAGIASQTWTCTATGGATCAGSGSGAINDTIATFPAGSSVTYVITGALAANPPSQVTNTASATPPAGGLCAPSNAPPCVASAALPVAAIIGITKTADATTIVPGGTVTYTVTVSNTGSSDADGTTVSDALAAGVDAYNWTCTASGGAACTDSGTGAINDTISPFPAGSAVTYTIVATVGATPPQTIENLASATPPGGGVCAPGNSSPACTATVAISSLPQIGITKTADVSQVLAGGTIQYTVTVTNAGSATADGTTVSDPVAAGIASQSWTCAGSGGATCAASGTGAITDTLAAFPSGASVVYSVTAIVDGAPPASIVNTASTTPPAGGQCAPGGTTPPCTASVTTATSTPVPQLQIGKTASTGTLQPDGTVVYTIVVANTGSVAVTDATVSDPLPNGLAAFAWTCAGTGGATCPNGSGSGALNEAVPTIPAGGTLTYTVTATVAATPPSTITNTASVASAAQATCAPSGTPAPCSAAATAAVQGGPTTPAVPVPLSPWMLWTLALALLALGARATRRAY